MKQTPIEDGGLAIKEDGEGEKGDTIYALPTSDRNQVDVE